MRVSLYCGDYFWEPLCSIGRFCSSLGLAGMCSSSNLKSGALPCVVSRDDGLERHFHEPSSSKASGNESSESSSFGYWNVFLRRAVVLSISKDLSRKFCR